jgi:hypothetical protein
MGWIKIEDGIGIGHGSDMFALFEDGAFVGGASVPRFPCTFGAAVTWGYSRYGPYRGRWCLALNYTPGLFFRLDALFSLDFAHLCN